MSDTMMAMVSYGIWLSTPQRCTHIVVDDDWCDFLFFLDDLMYLSGERLRLGREWGQHMSSDE